MSDGPDRVERPTGATGAPAADPFAEDAGAYVLGALDEADREAFEAHLATCDACRAAVADVADMPRLLAAVPPEGLADPPPSVLLGLLAEVGRDDAGPGPASPGASVGAAAPADELAARRAARRRGWWTGAGLVAAAAAGFVAAAAVLPGGAPQPAPTTTVALEPESAAVPVDASVALEEVAWGTRLTVTCTYRTQGGDPYAGPAGEPVVYALVVRDAQGRAEQVATWTAVPGHELTVPAATGLSADQIVRVEMLSGDQVVLAAPVEA